MKITKEHNCKELDIIQIQKLEIVAEEKSQTKNLWLSTYSKLYMEYSSEVYRKSSVIYSLVN